MLATMAMQAQILVARSHRNMTVDCVNLLEKDTGHKDTDLPN